MSNHFTPRPTIYNGIRMRSRLEAAWAEQFDAFGWAWEYEPFAVATTAGQYLPDFRIAIHQDAPPVYAEVKPSIFAEPERRGMTTVRNVDEWNAAWQSFDADLKRMGDTVRANVEAAAFILCVGSNSDGQVAIYADRPDPDNRAGHTLVVPCQCALVNLNPWDLGPCTSLVADPHTTGCRQHRHPWERLPAVASLYAPNGFLYYPNEHVDLRDVFDEQLHGDGG